MPPSFENLWIHHTTPHSPIHLWGCMDTPISSWACIIPPPPPLPREKPGFAGAGHLTWREARFCWSRSPYLERSQVLLEQVTLPGEKPSFAGAGHISSLYEEGPGFAGRSELLIVKIPQKILRNIVSASGVEWILPFLPGSVSHFPPYLERGQVLLEQVTFPLLPREKPGFAGAGHMFTLPGEKPGFA